MSIKIKTEIHTERFQKCKNKSCLVDTQASFEECVLAHQCFDDEPCPHMLALSISEPMKSGNPRLKELSRFL